MKTFKIVLAVLVVSLAFCLGMIYNSFNSIAQLEKLASDDGVKVHYVDTDTMRDAQEKYNFNGTPLGLYYSDSQTIYVDANGYFDYAILAHELGHHFAIKQWNDHSEPIANIYGASILRSTQ